MYECRRCRFVPPGYNTKLRSVSSLICRSSAWGSATDSFVPSSIGFPHSSVLSTSEYGGGSESGCAPRRAGLKPFSQSGVKQGYLDTMHKPYSGSILSKASWLEAKFSEKNPDLLVVTRQVHDVACTELAYTGWIAYITSAMTDSDWQIRRGCMGWPMTLKFNGSKARAMRRELSLRQIKTPAKLLIVNNTSGYGNRFF